MKRRVSKKRQQKNKPREALWQRAYDLLLGAGGGYTDVDHFFSTAPDERGSMVAELGTETFGRWLGAITQHLTFATDAQRAFIVKPSNLDRYDDFDKAIDWLFELGVRR